MTNIKKYTISTTLTLSLILALLFLITIIYYFNLITMKTFGILKLLTILISTFITSFFLGTKTNNKGYLEGIKQSLILIVIFLIPTILTSNFNLKVFIYYLIILITSSLGSMIGINKKKKD